MQATQLHLLQFSSQSAGVTGATIKIDSNGDSEGNFSVLAFKPNHMMRENILCDFHMIPVGYFQQGEDFPVSNGLNLNWFEIPPNTFQRVKSALAGI